MTSQILLIEDEDTAAYLTLRMLKSCGFNARVDVVRNGIDALEYLNRNGRYADRQPEHPSLSAISGGHIVSVLSLI